MRTCDFEDTTLRTRLWGHATLRTMRLWGHATLRTNSKFQNIKKYWIYDANTLGIYVIWRVSGRPSGAGLEKVCNFEGFCLGNVHILLDICCQNLGIYVIWRVSGRPSGAGLGNVHFWTFFTNFWKISDNFAKVCHVQNFCPQSRMSSKSPVLKVACPQSRVLNVAVLNVACPQCPIGVPLLIKRWHRERKNRF